MSKNLTTQFYKYSYIRWLAIVLILVSGLTSFYTLPKAEDPRIVSRYSVVITSYPGAPAERVEALVTEVLENELRRSPEIKHMDSRSMPELSVILVELKDEITDPPEVWAKMRDYVNDAVPKLPEGALPPKFDDTRGYPYTNMFAFVPQEPGTKELLLAKRYATELATRLRVVSGTDIVTVLGVPAEEILIEADPQKLANLGLTISRLAQIIKSHDTKLASGTIYHQQQRIILEVEGGFESIARLRELPILANQDAVTLLKDIATIKVTEREPASGLVFVNGKRSILLSARMLGNLNINDWSDRIDKVADELEKDLPEQIKLQKVFDQQVYTDKRFDDLYRNVLIGMCLIVIVLFATMGWRAAIVVSMALPLTVLLTLYGLNLIGLDLQQISVIGLILSLGIMIDNAIVIAEAIQHKKLKGVPALQAVEQTTSHFWLPLTGATLTTILAFVPVVLLPGMVGEFLEGISYSVIFTLVGSYLIAHTLIASFAGFYLGNQPSAKWYENGLQLDKLTKKFHQFIAYCTKHYVATVAAVFGITFIGILAQLFITEQFFPASDRDQINIAVYGAPAKDIASTSQAIVNMNDALKEMPEVTSQVWFVGVSAPPYYYNILQREENNPSYAQGMITVATEDIPTLVKRMQKALNKKFPEFIVLVNKIDQGPPFNAAIEVRIYGQDLSRLQYIGDQVRQRLDEMASVTYTRETLIAGLPKASVNLNEQQVYRLGLTGTELAQMLQHSTDGVTAGFVLEATEQLPVRVRLDAKSREQLSDILELPLQLFVDNKKYAALPLSAVADINIIPAWQVIPRRDSRRVNVIEGYVAADSLPEQTLALFTEQLEINPIKIPENYKIELGGEREKRDEALGNLVHSFPLVLVAMFGVLLLIFKGIVLVLIILFVGGLSYSMGVLSLYISGYPFGFQVIIGLLGLIGLAINAGIVILTEIISDPKARHGDLAAINRCVYGCLRHIASTTLTTVAGLMPLIISGGYFWPPFAIAIAGGTAITTLLSIVWVPAHYKLSLRYFPPAT